MDPIQFNKPFVAGKELFYIADAVTRGNISGDGHFTHRCAEILQSTFGIPKVLMTPSCTAALEMAAMLCDLGPGDEVIMPSYTFVSTANAVVRTGARPVFVDILPDTLNLDPALVQAAITPQTKAIFPVHYAGVGCDMDRITELAAAHRLLVVEDAAQGVNASYKRRALGTIGQLGAYSFHETKCYMCGEGGALCINDPTLVERAEVIRDKGTNRQKFFRGEVDKYSWVDIGSSYVPSEISCAFLCGQLELLEPIAAQRGRIYQYYQHHLADLAATGFLQLPTVPDECQTNYHMFYIVLASADLRDRLLLYLQDQAIQAVIHYVPLHSSPQGKKLGCESVRLPVTEDISGRLLRLPFFHEITEHEQARIVKTIHEFAAKNKSW